METLQQQQQLNPKGNQNPRSGDSECVCREQAAACHVESSFLPTSSTPVPTLEANHHTVYGNEALYLVFLYKYITNPNSNLIYIITFSYCS